MVQGYESGCMSCIGKGQEGRKRKEMSSPLGKASVIMTVGASDCGMGVAHGHRRPRAHCQGRLQKQQEYQKWVRRRVGCHKRDDTGGSSNLNMCGMHHNLNLHPDSARWTFFAKSISISLFLCILYKIKSLEFRKYLST